MGINSTFPDSLSNHHSSSPIPILDVSLSFQLICSAPKQWMLPKWVILGHFINLWLIIPPTVGSNMLKINYKFFMIKSNYNYVILYKSMKFHIMSLFSTITLLTFWGSSKGAKRGDRTFPSPLKICKQWLPYPNCTFHHQTSSFPKSNQSVSPMILFLNISPKSTHISLSFQLLRVQATPFIRSQYPQGKLQIP